MQTTLIIVRHGQTEWNRIERFRGRYDVPLNAAGLDQALRTARRIAEHWQPQAVYTSPLSRAVQTADAIASACGQVATIEEGLLDIDYGAWQGLTPEEASAKWPEQVRAWYEQPEAAQIPGGETLQQVRERSMAAAFQALNHHAGAAVVLVSHTVVNRLMLLAMLGLGNQRFWRLRQEPCAINVVLAAAQDFTLQLYNDTCHLET